MTASAARTLYVAINVAFVLGVLVLGLAGPAAEPRAAYLILLMLACSSVLLWIRELNGRYTLLAIFLAAYFVFYGAADAFALVSGRPASNSRGFFSAAEFGVLLGVVLAILGYRLALHRAPATPAARITRDWPPALVIATGIAFWAAGTATDWYWQLNITSMAAFEGKNGAAMLAAVVARTLQPLGTVMLGYAVVTTRSRPLLVLVLAFMGLQMLVGFIGNTKEIAMRGLIILTMCAFLLQGRVPKAWLALGVAFAVLVFPIFQAYRAEVIGVRGMSRTAAAEDILRSIELALQAKDKVERGANEDYKVPSFLERTALKPTLEMLVERTGGDGPGFQNGYTLYLYLTGFVPRFIWPDKPDSSVGKLVNREFHVSEDPDTYISATHLGELYWNFGWPGLAAGMLALGSLLGWINSRCNLAEGRSLTRLLVLVTTIYAAIVRFEGSIALEYIVFTRSLLVIWVLHKLFARVVIAPDASREPARGASTPAVPLIVAPHLLR